MNVLVIGAGAVGQVFGSFLARGGARVSVFVKAKHVEAAGCGFVVRSLRGRTRAESERFVPAEVLTSVEGRTFEHVVVCVSSTGLADAARVAGAIAGANVAAIQPGLDDPAVLAAHVAPERISWGMFPLVSFSEGETTRFYLPPLAKVPFSGGRARELVEAFQRGGLPARVVLDVQRSLPFSSAAINLHMSALECSRWSLRGLASDRALLELLHAALREACALIAKHKHLPVPWLFTRFRPWLSRVALTVAPKLAPFDLEHYFERHFSKVADQTAAQLDRYISRGVEQGLETTALTALRTKRG